MWDKIKAHPWIVGAVVGIIGVWWYLSSGTASSVSSGQPGGAGDNSLAIAQLQAQTTMAGITAAGNAQAEQYGAGLQIAQLQSSSVDLANTLAASVKLSEIGAAADVAKQTNTLSANVALGAQQEQIQLANVASATQIQTTKALTGVLSQQIAASQAVSTQSWINKIFG